MIKKNLFKLFLALVLLGIVSSCQKETIEKFNETQSNEECLIDFKNLKVEHNYNAPIEALYYEKEDLKSLYFKRIGKGNQLKSSNLKYPSLDEIADIEEENLKKYPNFDELSDKDIEWIKRDFPKLTEKEIVENIEIISDYYIKNLQYDLIIALTEKRNTLKSSYLGASCSEEFWFLSTKPTAATKIREAKNDAIKYTEELYGHSWGRDQSDAFRHIIWSTLIGKYYGKRKKSIGKGVDMARKFTNIHEECNNRDGQPECDAEMDYHNNWIGRDYFRSISKIKKKKRRFWFTKKWLSCPKNSVIKQTIKNKVDNGIKVDASVSAVESIDKYIPVYF